MTQTRGEEYVVVVNAEGRLVRERRSSGRVRRQSTRRAHRSKRPRDRKETNAEPE